MHWLACLNHRGGTVYSAWKLSKIHGIWPKPQFTRQFVFVCLSFVCRQMLSATLRSRMKRLAVASLAGFALGSLLEFAFYKSGYCKFVLHYFALLVAEGVGFPKQCFFVLYDL